MSAIDFCISTNSVTVNARNSSLSSSFPCTITLVPFSPLIAARSLIPSPYAPLQFRRNDHESVCFKPCHYLDHRFGRAACGCVVVGRVRAQDLDNVTITGRVLDQNGAIIPGATIEAILVKTGATRTTVTDDEGRYRIIQLEPGSLQSARLIYAALPPRKKRS